MDKLTTEKSAVHQQAGMRSFVERKGICGPQPFCLGVQDRAVQNRSLTTVGQAPMHHRSTLFPHSFQSLRVADKRLRKDGLERYIYI